MILITFSCIGESTALIVTLSSSAPACVRALERPRSLWSHLNCDITYGVIEKYWFWVFSKLLNKSNLVISKTINTHIC